MCALPKKNPEAIRPRGSSYPAETTLGLRPLETQIALQTDVAKELCNKIAWALGSTYRVPYANMRTNARQYAWRLVKQVIEDNGYPSKIAK